jgi:hypothetical protein
MSKKKPFRPPICPYCDNAAKLVDSAIVYTRSYGLIWHCAPCKAWVGVHKNSPNHVPLGRLANAELREWKKRAHSAFDRLWKEGALMSRTEAYKALQERLGMTKSEAHIGKFDVADCKRVVEAFHNG